jgi:hypothetical protein
MKVAATIAAISSVSRKRNQTNNSQRQQESLHGFFSKM